MSQANPLVRRYLDQLEAGLVGAEIQEDERRDIRKDIESHLAEATRTGVSLVDALTRLGPADDLARAYCLELTLNPRPEGDRSRAQWMITALTRAGALLASTLLTIVMGGLSVALLVGGLAAVAGGLIAPFLPPTVLDPTLRPGLPQAVVIMVGVILLAAGVPSFRLVQVNLRFLIHTLRKDLTRGIEMKNFRVVSIGGLLLAAGLIAPVVAKERVLEQQLPAGGIEELVLHGGNGSASIVVGDEDVIRIRCVVRPGKLSDKEPWQGIKKWFLSSAYEDVNELIEALRLETDASGDRKLELDLRPPRRTRESRVGEDWSITVPRRLAVRISMARADTEVMGVAGGVDVSVGNGSVEIDVPGGDLDIEVTVGTARVRTGSADVRELRLRSQVGETKLWMNGMRVKYSDPPGPGSKITVSGEGDDSVRVFVQVGDASLRVNER